MQEFNTVAAGSNPGRGLPFTRSYEGASTSARRMLAVSRLVVVFVVIAVSLVLFAIGLGFLFAQYSDDRLSFEQHAGLRSAIGEFQSPIIKSGEINPNLVRVAGQIVGVKNMKFQRELDGTAGEIQPVMSQDGRIAGFFTWEKAHSMMETMKRLAPLTGAIVVIMVGFGAVSLRQLKSLRRELAVGEEAAARAADADKLTGLPNHAKILELLDLALAERADEECTTFVLIELDRMDDITAQSGVLGSDELIVAVGTQLKDALPAHAMCGRIANDEFAIALTANKDIDPETIIRAVLDSITRPHWLDTVMRVSAYAGFAQVPQHATTRGELTRRADLALRAAAKKGPGAIVMFDLSIDTISMDQKFIHRELPRAISANELELHYQPIVASQGGRMVGVEALLRWTHPTRGAIPPATFIPVAEQMGLMDTIGAFVLRRALQEAKRWPHDLYVAVNLSPLQVRDRTIVDIVRSALSESMVAPSRLVLEITEGVLIDDPDEMVKRIKDLHSLGVRVALDDFGSGYSNLGYLQRFPLDKLKIDKSFVAALDRSANGGVIIQAIVALGRALGLSVLVEGVETEHQRVLLRLAGCDEMQGFLFAKPAPAQAIDRLLAQAKQGGKPLSSSGEALTA